MSGKSHASMVVVGNVGKDSELRFLPNGTGVTTFSVAVSHSHKKGEEWETETDWWNVKVFGQSAERASEQVTKGKLVLVDGTPRQRSWEDNEGKKRTMVELIANKFVILSPKDATAQPVAQEQPTPAVAHASSFVDEEPLPF